MDDEPPKPVDDEQPSPPPEKQWVYGTPEELLAADPWLRAKAEERGPIAVPLLFYVPGLIFFCLSGGWIAGLLYFLSSYYLATKYTKINWKRIGLAVLFFIGGILLMLALLFGICAVYSMGTSY